MAVFHNSLIAVLILITKTKPRKLFDTMTLLNKYEYVNTINSTELAECDAKICNTTSLLVTSR